MSHPYESTLPCLPGFARSTVRKQVAGVSSVGSTSAALGNADGAGNCYAKLLPLGIAPSR